MRDVDAVVYHLSLSRERTSGKIISTSISQNLNQMFRCLLYDNYIDDAWNIQIAISRKDELVTGRNNSLTTESL